MDILDADKFERQWAARFRWRRASRYFHTYRESTIASVLMAYLLGASGVAAIILIINKMFVLAIPIVLLSLVSGFLLGETLRAAIHAHRNLYDEAVKNKLGIN